MLKASDRARRGFTLLEVMVAMAILAVSLVAIAGINTAAIGMHSYAKRLSVATLLARSKMADMESKLMSEDLPADDTAEEGTFEDDGFAEYHWRAEIIRPKTENVTPSQLLSMAGLDDSDPSKKGSGSGAPAGGLAGMVAGLTGGTGTSTSAPTGMAATASAAATGGAGLMGSMMTGQVQTMLDMLGKSVREVRLTVSWETGKQVDQFTIVTHIVSLGAGTDQVNSDPLQQAAAGSGSNINSLLQGGMLGGTPAANMSRSSLQTNTTQRSPFKASGGGFVP